LERFFYAPPTRKRRWIPNTFRNDKGDSVKKTLIATTLALAFAIVAQAAESKSNTATTPAPRDSSWRKRHEGFVVIANGGAITACCSSTRLAIENATRSVYKPTIWCYLFCAPVAYYLSS
jgi:hypothetical protein